MLEEKHVCSVRTFRGGYTSLDVYLPHSFFGSGAYAAFVGGCGRGHEMTFAEAARLAKAAYLADKEQRVKDLRREADYYDRQVRRLRREWGLKR